MRNDALHYDEEKAGGIMEDKSRQQSESFTLAILLAIVGGFLDAYTYCCRDQVFANAQTGNIVKVGITLANGEYMKTVRYSIPILAFSVGVLMAMYMKERYNTKFHWRQVVLFVEAVIIVIVGFIPMNEILNILANIMISFLCAMQAESFRKVLGKPFSSTMCTGNLRSATEYFYHAVADKNDRLLINMSHYVLIIMAFIAGAFIGVYLTQAWLQHAVFFTLIPMLLSIYIMKNRITGSQELML